MVTYFYLFKVEKILKGRQDLIPSPSPSMKIQIIGGKVCKTLLGQKKICFQKFVDNTLQLFAFTPQANFPAHNLNFHWRWRWWNRIQATNLNFFYFIRTRVNWNNGSRFFFFTKISSRKMIFWFDFHWLSNG